MVNARTTTRPGGLGKRIYRQRHCLIMLAPALLLTLLFSYVPLSGWYIALTN